MDKPIVVCGVDFSGTSMLAGMLHAAGIDMGDVESEEDVAIVDRPVRYRTFEDRELKNKLTHLAELQMANLPDITHAWLEAMYDKFMGYVKWRNAMANGKRWGVKNNGLMFLAMHEKFADIPVQWVTTYRPQEDSLLSCSVKLGANPRYAALMGIEFLTWYKLIEKGVPEVPFVELLYGAPGVAKQFSSGWLKISPDKIEQMSAVVDPIHKGIIPWRGSSQPLQSVAHS